MAFLNLRAPRLLWVTGAFVSIALAVVGIDRLAACGPAVWGDACAQQFARGLPRAIWLAFVVEGLVAAAIGAASLAGRPRWSERTGAILAWVGAGLAIVYALVAVIALNEYGAFVVVAVNWLLVLAFERRRPSLASLLDLAILFVGWAAALTIAWDGSLGTWLFGAFPSGPSISALVAFAILLVLNVGALTANGANAGRRTNVRYGLDALAIALFAAVSFRQDFFSDPGSSHHWGFFVGPAELVRQGGWLLWDVPSQYGFFSTLAIVAMPFRSAWQSLYVLDALMLLASACLLYYVLRALRLGRFSFAFSFLTALTMVYLMPGNYGALSGPQFYPSVGAFRFLWVEAVVAVLAAGYAMGFDGRRKLTTLVAGNLLWLIGVFWSAESAIYVTIVWIPSHVMLAFPASEGRTFRERLRALSGLPALVPMLLPVLFFVGAVALVESTYLIALGHGPDYFAFYEFGLSYGTGFGAYPIDALGPVWSLLFGFAVCVATCTAFIANKAIRAKALPLLYASAALFWVVCSYFVSRSSSPNATNISTPIWLAVAAVLLIVDRERLEAGGRQVHLALIAPLTIALAFTVGNVGGIETLARTLSVGYRANVLRLLPQLPPEALALLEREGVAETDPIVYDGMTLMPERPFPRVDSVPGARWVPANPTIMLTVIRASRRLTYFARFTARRPMEGWYLRAHSPTNTCESFDPQYATDPARNYATDTWDLSWCKLVR